MDAQDATRIATHLDRLLTALQEQRVLTNHRVREIAGSRGMGRVNELQKLGYPITVRKTDKSTWEVRYESKAQGRSAESFIDPSASLPLFPDPHPSGWHR